MKYGNKIIDIILTGLLIPLWIDVLLPDIQRISGLRWAVIVLASLVIAVIFARAIYDFVIIYAPFTVWQCRRIDAFVIRTRKKLKNIILRTDIPTVLEHAFIKLREISPPEVYSDILKELALKERNPDKKKTLEIQAKQSGGKT